MQTKICQLSQQQKPTVIHKLRNFPTLPQIEELGQMNQDQVLAEYFPWGCQGIRERVIFKADDVSYNNKFHDFSNICLGIKYGICPFFTADKFSQTRKGFGNFYLKLIAEGSVKNKILSLARVTEINPFKMFRFWHHQKGTLYPLGIAKIEVIAVGQIPEEKNQSLEDVYYSLKRSVLDWKYFKAADDLQKIEREKYVLAINRNQCQKLEEELEEKNLSMLDMLRSV